MKSFAFLLFIFVKHVCGQFDKDINDKEILDRINIDGKCYDKNNWLFYPIRNTVLIDADSVVFDFRGAINHTMMCCMFSGTRFFNSSFNKIRRCTRNTPQQIQNRHGVSCCKFHHSITFRSGFDSYLVKNYTTNAQLTERITSEQVKAALKKRGIKGELDQVVYEGFFQFHYPRDTKNVKKPIYAPSKPGRSFISRTWHLVRGLPDVRIATESTIAVPGVMISCSVSNATTPRVRLYPSVKPTLFDDECDFHTMRIRSHQPRASQLANSRSTYPHFNLPQVATYVKARSWSIFPKCAFKLGKVGTKSVSIRCRTSVANSHAYTDAWSANFIQMTLYNPSVKIKHQRTHHYFIHEVELGFIFPATADSPYRLRISIPTSSEKAIFHIHEKEATLSFYKDAAPGVYTIETKVIPKRTPSILLINANDVIFKETLTLSLHVLKPVVDPFATVHYVFEIVRCRASVDSEEFFPFLRWDVGNLDSQVRSKLVFRENGTAFFFEKTVEEAEQPITFHCRLGSRKENVKSVKHTFKISGKPSLRLTPTRRNYHLEESVTCETERKSYGEVVLNPMNVCKDEDSWCQQNIQRALQDRNRSDTFVFPFYLKESDYKLLCEIRPFNSTNTLSTEIFTISYVGIKMKLSPSRTHFNFHTEITCVPIQHAQSKIYLEFPPAWSQFVHRTRNGSFYISDVPSQGWLTFFCGVSDFKKRKVGKNFTIFVGDYSFGKLEARNKHQQHSVSWEFYTYAVLAGCIQNLLLLYVAFAINFLIRIHEQKKNCVRRFIEKYNIVAYDEVAPGFFNNLLTFACEEDMISSAPVARHLHTTN